MSEMVERVAKALLAESVKQGFPVRDFEPPWALFVSDARAAIAAMSGWQPIETAPTDETEILGVDRHKCYRVVWVWWWEDGKPVWFDGDCQMDPTHWMPLPEPPK